MIIREITALANMDGFGLPSPISGVLFGGEDQAHKFIIRRDDGTAFAGTVTAKFLRYADDVTVPLTGSIEDGAATVTLIENCYMRPGRFKLTVYVTQGGSTTAIYCCMGTVDRTDGQHTIDPSGEINLDVTDLINRINTATASVPADYTALLATIAPTFSALTAYASGEYVWYNGTLYRFTADHAAGTWTGTDAAAAVLVEDISELKSVFSSVTEVLNYFSIKDATVDGVKIENVENGIKVNRLESGVGDAVFELGTLEAGKYTAEFTSISGELSGTSVITLRWGSGSGTRWVSFAQGANPVTVTFDAETRIFLRFSKGGSATDFIMQCQISKGETAGDYSAESLSAVDQYARDRLIELDSTLTETGKAADAKAAGDAINEVADALNVATGKLPDYWETAIAAKINAMLPYYADSQMDGDAFIFLTDYHYDPTRPTQTNNGWSHLLVKRIMRELPIKMFVFGGDAINGNADKNVALQQLEEVSRRFGEDDVYGIRGNHDLNLDDYTLDPEDPTAQRVSDSAYYALFTKDVEDKIVLASSAFTRASDKQKVCLDYYHDNVAQKIRYIFIDTKHEDSEYGNVTATQIQWMQARIQELTSEWSVIVFAHQYFKDITVTPPTYRQAHKIYDGIKGIIDTVDCTVIGIITGHIHEDFAYTANGFLEIATTTDSMQIGNTTKNPGYEVGTAGEQAFDVFVLDKANRKLKAFRVGHGQDREWTY